VDFLGEWTSLSLSGMAQGPELRAHFLLRSWPRRGLSLFFSSFFARRRRVCPAFGQFVNLRLIRILVCRWCHLSMSDHVRSQGLGEETGYITSPIYRTSSFVAEDFFGVLLVPRR
jgi:hypothetical protein